MQQFSSILLRLSGALKLEIKIFKFIPVLSELSTLSWVV
jgi:hypothetical protein